MVSEMTYSREEIIGITADLACAYHSDSSSYLDDETAAQLISAVLFCLQEAEKPADKTGLTAGSCRDQYAFGLQRAEKKLLAAKHLYRSLQKNLIAFDNEFLQETFQTELPHWLRTCNVRYTPHIDPLFLSYPVLYDLSNMHGIDRVYAYLRCIELEQKFLHTADIQNIWELLSRHWPGYQTYCENLCTMVLTALTLHTVNLSPHVIDRNAICKHLYDDLQANCEDEKLQKYLHMAITRIVIPAAGPAYQSIGK